MLQEGFVRRWGSVRGRKVLDHNRTSIRLAHLILVVTAANSQLCVWEASSPLDLELQSQLVAVKMPRGSYFYNISEYSCEDQFLSSGLTS